MVKAQCASITPAAGETAAALRGVEMRTGLRKSGPAASPERVEIQLYLSKLKQLVPHMPKNRKVSKLEVIQHVIDYICDLQTALESHPKSRRTPAPLPQPPPPPPPSSAVVASIMAAPSTSLSASRQPLGLLSANPNPMANVCTVQEVGGALFEPDLS